MIITRSPLRISLGGGGTDLPSYYSRHGGYVLSAAIDKYLYICVNRPAADDLIRLKYSRYEEVSDVADIEHDLVRPTLELLDVRSNIEITSMADVPAGTGLGSSSTYLVALLTALHELKRERVPTQALAELAIHIEMELARHPVGKQDHYLAAFGGITALEIEPDGRVHPTPLNIAVGAAEQLRDRLMLFFTHVNRGANEILAAQRDATDAGAEDVLESLHMTKSIGFRIRDALERGDVDDLGHLMHEHWENKKRRPGGITNERIDGWYDAARAAGALGGKVVGAGGGGFLLLYCRPEVKGAVRATLARDGLREMVYAFDFEGAKVLMNF